MAGLLDFLFQGQGGGLLGGMGGSQMGPDGMPLQISPPPQQQMLNVPNSIPQAPSSGGQYPGGMDPLIYAQRALRPQQPSGLLFNAQSGPFGSMKGALDQIANPNREEQRQQQAMQNYIALKQLGLQEQAAQEKPQYQKIMGADGQEHIVLLQPLGRGAAYVNPTNAPAGAPGAVPTPPGVTNVKAYNEKISQDAAANEQEAIKSAKAAAELQPYLDEAKKAYDEVNRLGANGPVAANPYIGRPLATGMAVLGDATGLGNQGNWKEAESARQRYETAIANVKARVTAAQNRGEGQVSNYERQLYGAQFPSLTALDYGSQAPFWEHQTAENRRTIEAAKKSGLSQNPAVGTVLNRGAVTPDAGAPAAGAPPSAAMPQAAPSMKDAKRAPDGNYYVPDPARPGKYLKVTP